MINYDILPKSEESEQAVLGGLMLDSNKLTEVTAILKESDFYSRLHQKIFRVMLKLAKQNMEFDVITIGDYPEINDLAYIASMVSNTPGTSNIVAYARIVHELAQRRRILEVIKEMELSTLKRHTEGEKLSETIINEFHSRLEDINRDSFNYSTVSDEDVGKMKISPVKWLIPQIIAVGSNLLAGPPKIGKSMLALEIAIAISQGLKIFGGIQVDPGNVLYLALEDNIRRLQTRQRKILKENQPSGNLHYATNWKRIGEGGLELLKQEVIKLELRCVIIDTLAAIRPIGNYRENPYMADYTSAQLLTKFANDLEIGVIVVHHTNKGNFNNPFDRISGTTGLQGGFDALLLLIPQVTKDSKDPEKKIEQTMLYTNGRDIENSRGYPISFDKTKGSWLIQFDVGSEMPKEMSPERAAIFEIIKTHEPITSREIAKILNNGKEIERESKENKRVKYLLDKLKTEGLIYNQEDGYRVRNRF